MEAILKFSLPEETELYNIYNNAHNYQAVLFDFDQYLRAESKYTEGENAEIASKIREKLYIILNEYNITL